MTFREIDEQIYSLIDEDGEILNAEAFDALQMERTEKVKGLGMWVLDLEDEQDALKKEIDRLTARKRAAERKEASIKEFLRAVLNGEKLKTDTVTISYRNSAAVEITDEHALREWAQTVPDACGVLKQREPEISKTALKDLLNLGETIPGAEMVNRVSVIIK